MCRFVAYAKRYVWPRHKRVLPCPMLKIWHSAAYTRRARSKSYTRRVGRLTGSPVTYMWGGPQQHSQKT
jgi:hypothetical protein